MHISAFGLETDSAAGCGFESELSRNRAALGLSTSTATDMPVTLRAQFSGLSSAIAPTRYFAVAAWAKVADWAAAVAALATVHREPAGALAEGSGT
jgi:hypothetical protein